MPYAAAATAASSATSGVTAPSLPSVSLPSLPSLGSRTANDTKEVWPTSPSTSLFALVYGSDQDETSLYGGSQMYYQSTQTLSAPARM